MCVSGVGVGDWSERARGGVSDPICHQRPADTPAGHHSSTAATQRPPGMSDALDAWCPTPRRWVGGRGRGHCTRQGRTPTHDGGPSANERLLLQVLTSKSRAAAGRASWPAAASWSWSRTPWAAPSSCARGVEPSVSRGGPCVCMGRRLQSTIPTRLVNSSRGRRSASEADDRRPAADEETRRPLIWQTFGRCFKGFLHQRRRRAPFAV